MAPKQLAEQMSHIALALRPTYSEHLLKSLQENKHTTQQRELRNTNKRKLQNHS